MSEQIKQPVPNVHIVESHDTSLLGRIKGLLPQKPSLPHLVILIFILVILGEIFFGLKDVVSPISGVTNHNPISGGTIVLHSEKTNYEVNEKIDVQVKVSTGGHSTDGVDLVLNYDPNYLELDRESFFKKGLIYPDYPFVDVENNTISISAISSTGGGTFNGVGNFGTLEFRAKKAGNIKLSLEANKDSTSDTNITETGSALDILEAVSSLELSIGSSGNSKKDAEPNSCENYTQICTNDKGMQGTQECSKGGIKDNKCSFDPVLTESCSVCKVN